MGGEAGFRTLISEGQKLGFAMMPMFGANAANRKRSDFDPSTTLLRSSRTAIGWI